MHSTGPHRPTATANADDRGRDGQLVGDLLPWVATAPEPALAITDHTAVITNVRFVWAGTYCAYCRQHVDLWTDGGTIDAGLKVGRPSRRSPAGTAHWYKTYRPCGVPVIPDSCPHPACWRPKPTPADHQDPTAWLDGKWRLSAGPFTVGPRADERCPHPVHPKTHRLLDEIWTTLRRTHPDLAAAADAYDAEQHRRAERG